jgi:cholinesterase
MRRRLFGLLLLALLIAAPTAAQPPDRTAPTAAPTSAAATSYSRLYVFGDSYSDIGAGYIDGNGPTAVAYLAWLLGLRVAPGKPTSSGDQSLVYAVSGAGTGEGTGRQVKDALLGYGMLNQVRDFAARVTAGAITFEPDTTLFFLAGGLNDGKRETAATLDNLRQQLEILKALGGRHFTIARLPTRIPQFAAVGQRLNPAYEWFVREEAKALGIDLWLNHWGAAFDEVMEQPATYGITNTTSACAGRAIFDQEVTPIGDPATFFFYHDGHPSTAVHRIVGRKLFDEIAARGQTSAARLTVTPSTVLLDERFRITLEGAEPGQDVTIRVDGNRGAWHGSATFRSDARGRVEVADPMRLVWSATGERPAMPAAGGGQPWTFTAEIGGRVVATQTIVRRPVAEDVCVVTVRERGLVGIAYYPPGAGPHPAIIVLPGSQGGVPPASSVVGGLASRGYAVLALAYFNAEGLPPLLQDIPLEYFATAVDWLKAQRAVDGSRIGLMGTSRGGELALLLGATYPAAFRVVVANVPSNVVWPSLSTDVEAPAWTVNGAPVVSVPSHFTAADRELSSRDRFLKRMQDPAALAGAEIAVERIGGPVLLLSGKDDQLWPSDLFASRVVERLRARHFTHPVEHYSYEDAGHMIARPFTPTSDVRQVRIHPVSKRPVMMGGTPEGQARANEDAWEKLLAFLQRYLEAR